MCVCVCEVGQSQTVQYLLVITTSIPPTICISSLATVTHMGVVPLPTPTALDHVVCKATGICRYSRAFIPVLFSLHLLLKGRAMSGVTTPEVVELQDALYL